MIEEEDSEGHYLVELSCVFGETHGLTLVFWDATGDVGIASRFLVFEMWQGVPLVWYVYRFVFIIFRGKCGGSLLGCVLTLV